MSRRGLPIISPASSYSEPGAVLLVSGVVRCPTKGWISITSKSPSSLLSLEGFSIAAIGADSVADTPGCLPGTLQQVVLSTGCQSAVVNTMSLGQAASVSCNWWYTNMISLG